MQSKTPHHPLLQRPARLIAGVMALMALWAAAACAHPHVMIEVEISFEIRGGALLAIRERWTFDEAYRKSTLEEFDKDRDGALDPGELGAYQALVLSTMRRFANFITIERGKTKARTREVALTKLDFSSPRPVIEFNLALSEPLAISEPILIEVCDPTYYSAFAFPAATALSVDADQGTACTANLIAPAKDGEQLKAYRDFAKAFGPIAARTVTPRAIALTCATR